MGRTPSTNQQVAPYPALTIAKWFIAWAEAEGEELSNLKLQKLLYYAQGHYLAERRQPLFCDEIQAWSHGPVVPQVYHEYKNFGSANITLPDTDPFTWEEVDAETAEFLGKVWNTYGGYSAGRLRNMTHEEPPWQRYWREDKRGIAIPVRDLEDHFRRVEAAAS
jgi:uncharacterized phage-associated protein